VSDPRLIEAVDRIHGEMLAREERRRDAKMATDLRAMYSSLAKPKEAQPMPRDDPNYGHDLFPASPEITGVNAFARPRVTKKDAPPLEPTGQVLYPRSPELYEGIVSRDDPIVIGSPTEEPIGTVTSEQLFPRSPSMTGSNRSGRLAAMEAHARARAIADDPEVKFPTTNPPAPPLSWPAAPVRHGNRNE
jgi:hypothetical protein